jgi:hypothetical protein
MRYTKDDVLRLKELVKEINLLIIDKFPCSSSKVDFKQKMDKTIEVKIYQEI